MHAHLGYLKMLQGGNFPDLLECRCAWWAASWAFPEMLWPSNASSFNGEGTAFENAFQPKISRRNGACLYPSDGQEPWFSRLKYAFVGVWMECGLLLLLVPHCCIDYRDLILESGDAGWYVQRRGASLCKETCVGEFLGCTRMVLKYEYQRDPNDHFLHLLHSQIFDRPYVV
jgi:hypothetical protein